MQTFISSPRKAEAVIIDRFGVPFPWPDVNARAALAQAARLVAFAPGKA